MGFTVSETVALLVASAWLVAFTLICRVELTEGAVNRPAESTVPAVADHVTDVFAVLLTTAVNCWVPPEKRVAFEGNAETLMLPSLLPPLPLLLLVPPTERPPPQAAMNIGPENIRRYRSHNLSDDRLRDCRPFPARSGLQISTHSAGKVIPRDSRQVASDILKPSSEVSRGVRSISYVGVTEGQQLIRPKVRKQPGISPNEIGGFIVFLFSTGSKPAATLIRVRERGGLLAI